jgi:hypothetical protein
MLNPPLVLDFVCPVCSAQPQEECELTTGASRFEPHVERKWVASDFELKQSLESQPAGREPTRH